MLYKEKVESMRNLFQDPSVYKACTINKGSTAAVRSSKGDKFLVLDFFATAKDLRNSILLDDMGVDRAVIEAPYLLEPTGPRCFAEIDTSDIEDIDEYKLENGEFDLIKASVLLD